MKSKYPCPKCENDVFEPQYNGWGGEWNLAKCKECGNTLNVFYETWYSGHSIGGKELKGGSLWQEAILGIYMAWTLLGWVMAGAIFSDPDYHASGNVGWGWVSLFLWLACVIWLFLPNKNQSSVQTMIVEDQ